MAHAKLLLLLAMASALLVTSAHGGSYRSGQPLRRPPRQRNSTLYSQPLALAVQGVVLCQNCSYLGTRSLKSSTPLQGAKVQLVCRSWRYKTFVYAIATTDENGYFFFKVPKFNFIRHNPLKVCRVLLVFSPSPTCSVPTNINSGKAGAFLLKLKQYPNSILYSTGPFAFAPRAGCMKSSPTHSSPPYVSPSSTYSPPSPTYSSPSPTSSSPPIYSSPSPTYSPPTYTPPSPASYSSPIHTSPSTSYGSPPVYNAPSPY